MVTRNIKILKEKIMSISSKEKYIKDLRESRRSLLKLFDSEDDEKLSVYYRAQARMVEMQILYLIKQIKNA
ncbi:hypothetical protein LCGC14_1114020 [marine sediment metagenome]|uniref:Uncharacterized protein n=1 Tax=marine sediment metagenome TaxID=412755 RepID=A0A0F9MTX5_9ZZZZ